MKLLSFFADGLGLYRVVLEEWKGKWKLLQSAGFRVEPELLSVHSRGGGKGHDRCGYEGYPNLEVPVWVASMITTVIVQGLYSGNCLIKMGSCSLQSFSASAHQGKFCVLCQP